MKMPLLSFAVLAVFLVTGCSSDPCSRPPKCSADERRTAEQIKTCQTKFAALTPACQTDAVQTYDCLSAKAVCGPDNKQVTLSWVDLANCLPERAAAAQDAGMTYECNLLF